MSFEVKIVEKATGEVEETMIAPTEREADQLKRGIMINLNRADYKVTITEVNS